VGPEDDPGGECSVRRARESLEGIVECHAVRCEIRIDTYWYRNNEYVMNVIYEDERTDTS
jgi:hypothetical protein